MEKIRNISERTGAKTFEEHLAIFKHCPVCLNDEQKRIFQRPPIQLYRCEQCKMMFLNPFLTPEGQAEIFSSKERLLEVSRFFGRYFEEAACNTPKTLRIYQGCMAELGIYFPDQGKLLDVGCGKGSFLKMAQARGWQVAGVETNEACARELRENCGIPVETGGFWATCRSQASWDVITLWDVIEHVPNPGEWIRACYDKLNSGGILLIATPNHASLLDFLSFAAYRLSFGLISHGLRKLYTIDHTLYFTGGTLAHLLEECGFEVLKTVKVNTDLARYSMSPVFRLLAESLLAASALLGLENRVIMLAQKPEVKS